MANINFLCPDKENLSDKPAYVSDLALALGADYGEMVQNEDGQMVHSGSFWTSSLSQSTVDGEIFGEVVKTSTHGKYFYDGNVNQQNVGILPCIENAAENGLTTVRLNDNPNDTREYLFDEKKQELKKAPQTWAGFQINEELYDLFHGTFEERIARLEKDYYAGRINQEPYAKKMAELQEKRDSFKVMENGFPTLQRRGGQKAGEDYLEELETVTYQGETYARYDCDSLRNFNNPVREGTKFNDGAFEIYNHKKGIGGEYWFKYEPILAERQANGNIQLRTVLAPIPLIQTKEKEEFNQEVAAIESGNATGPIRTMVGTYMNTVLAQHLGLTTDRTLAAEQEQQQQQTQAPEERTM